VGLHISVDIEPSCQTHQSSISICMMWSRNKLIVVELARLKTDKKWTTIKFYWVRGQLNSTKIPGLLHQTENLSLLIRHLDSFPQKSLYLGFIDGSSSLESICVIGRISVAFDVKRVDSVLEIGNNTAVCSN